MDKPWILLITVAYLLLLFYIAHRSEKKTNRFTNSGFTYALSLMVYCTAWTFYGSVGRASTTGLNFLAIYIGPLITIPFWWKVQRKIIRTTNVLRISSVADFLAIRYGKSATLGTTVAIACFLGIIPYISLQIKAITNSFMIMGEGGKAVQAASIVVLLTIFALLFGARNIDANKRKPGLVTAIAVESIIKLVAFLLVGVVVSFSMFDGLGDLFHEARNLANFQQLITIEGGGNYADWFFISLVSASAFFLLPRQFQLGSIEAGSEMKVFSSMKLVPIYLLLINLFVIPIAFAGMLLLPKENPDFYVLSLPLYSGMKWLAVVAFIGGFSAAASMILVSTTALSTMLSNYVFIPLILKSQKEEVSERTDYQSILLFWRRISIVITMALAYFYFLFMSSEVPLVSIGITSFIAVAQLAPAFFGGLFWKQANKKGALYGIISGLIIWFFMLVWPNFLHQLGVETRSLDYDFQFISDAMGVSHTSATIILSLLVNIGLYMYFSFTRQQDAKEVNQAELVVGMFDYANSYDASVAWRGTAFYSDIRFLLARFIGDDRAVNLLERYAKRNDIDLESNAKVDNRIISFAERILTGVIGPVSARIMVSSVVEEEEIGIGDVMEILQESQEVIKLNRELQLKSMQLERATENLKMANEKLTEYGELKNEFLYTVTHELRTPITSILALAELLEDVEEMEMDDQKRFINSIISEAERMSSLISNVLDLEKFESGNQQLNLDAVDLKNLIQEEVEAIRPLIRDQKIHLEMEMNSSLEPVYADAVRIRQVLNNLLGNAVKYCEQEDGLVRITAYHWEDQVKVNISNNGKEISEADLPHIFDKFYQARNQTREKPKGHGLGLAICKNIIDMHQGQIDVEIVNDLVRFSFSLPLFKKTA